MWTDKNREELVVGRVYSIPCSDNKFKLTSVFVPNTECFQREGNDTKHFGREFIAYEDGEAFVDVFFDN